MHLSHNFCRFTQQWVQMLRFPRGRGPRREWDEFKDQVVFAVAGEDADAAGDAAALQVR